MLAFVSGGFAIYSFDYLTEKPVYRCERKPGSGNYEVCTAEEICDSKPSLKFYVDKDSHESLDNWVETLDLMCK